MLTLSYGFKKPEANDKGSIVFPALEANIQQLNDHDHNGTNSKKISSASILPVTQSISSVGWVALGGGHYKQTVTLPGALTFDSIQIEFQDVASGGRLFLSVQKVAASQYDVFTSDNTLDLTAIYR